MKVLVIILCSVLIGYTAFSQRIETAKLESAILKADSLIENSQREFFKNVESLIVYSNDEIFFEKYYNGFDKNSLHPIQSQTKSIVALLMGIVIDRGFIKSENELVSNYFPASFNTEDTLKSTVTIRDLLTMSSGFEWEEMIPFNDPKNDNANMFHTNNWLNYALNRPMACKPYTQFNYNSGCSMIVAGIIEEATKMRLEEFAKTYLFTPLGITNYEWLKDGTGLCHAGGGLNLKPVDMLKIGILVLNKGKWEGKEIISEDWVNRSTTGYITTNFDISRYGYFWWIRQFNTQADKIITQVSAEGAGGQKLFIFPEYKLIIATTERNYYTPQVGPTLIRESILPLL